MGVLMSWNSKTRQRSGYDNSFRKIQYFYFVLAYAIFFFWREVASYEISIFIIFVVPCLPGLNNSSPT